MKTSSAEKTPGTVESGGTPWQLIALVLMIVLGVLGIVGKTTGLF